MNCKKAVSLCAVIAMLMVSGSCIILGGGADVAESSVTSTPVTVDTAYPLYIHSDGTLSGNLNDFKATYEDHVLTFNEDVSVNVVGGKYAIKTEYKGLRIVVNANVTLSADDTTDSFTGIQCNDDTTIEGSGSLTLNMPAISSEEERCIGIEFGNESTEIEAVIKNISLSINFSSETPKCYAIFVNSLLTIDKATVKIDNGDSDIDNWRSAMIAIVDDKTLVINESDVEIIVNKTKAIGPTDEEAITMSNNIVISYSTVKIKGSETKSGYETSGIFTTNISIYRSDVSIDLSHGGYMGIGSTDQAEGSSAVAYEGTCDIDDSSVSIIRNNGYGIVMDASNGSREYIKIKNSHVSFERSEDAIGDMVSRGIFIISSVVQSVGDSLAGGISLGSNGLITDSVVYIEGMTTGINLSYEAKLAIFRSDVNIHATYLDWNTPAFDGPAPQLIVSDKILASNDGTKPTTEILSDSVTQNSWVHIISAQTVYFDLGVGKGTAVGYMNGNVGEKIILPGCDAKDGDREFVGWTDGINTYRAGDEYEISITKTLYAVYDTPRTAIDTMAAIGAIAIAAIFIGILTTVFVEKR